MTSVRPPRSTPEKTVPAPRREPHAATRGNPVRREDARRVGTAATPGAICIGGGLGTWSAWREGLLGERGDDGGIVGRLRSKRERPIGVPGSLPLPPRAPSNSPGGGGRSLHPAAACSEGVIGGGRSCIGEAVGDPRGDSEGERAGAMRWARREGLRHTREARMRLGESTCVCVCCEVGRCGEMRGEVGRCGEPESVRTSWRVGMGRSRDVTPTPRRRCRGGSPCPRTKWEHARR